MKRRNFHQEESRSLVHGIASSTWYYKTECLGDQPPSSNLNNRTRRHKRVKISSNPNNRTTNRSVDHRQGTSHHGSVDHRQGTYQHTLQTKAETTKQPNNQLQHQPDQFQYTQTGAKTTNNVNIGDVHTIQSTRESTSGSVEISQKIAGILATSQLSWLTAFPH